LTGVSSSGNVGNLIFGITFPLIGNAATGNIQSVNAFTNLALAGVVANGFAGTIFRDETQFALIGNVSSGVTGTLNVIQQAVLLGVEAVGRVGTVSVPLRGANATGAVDSITVNYNFALTSPAIAVAIGLVGLGNRTFALTGVAANGAVGDVIAVYWKPIDDSQTANWQNINDAQTAAWAAIANAQASSWAATTNGQTPSWGTIGNSQTPGWVLADNAT
jgi:hypothetical protein